MTDVDPSLEDLAARAVDGDERALERLLGAIQDNVYGLALRMLGSESDARDCAQEILIRVMTRLSSFRGDSALTTWVYRIAANYLIDTKRRAREMISFDQVDGMLAQPASEPLGRRPDRDALIEEAFLGCTLGILRCLDREHRIAFILGGILELNSVEAAQVVEVTPAAFRKRLSRARQRLETFMRARCGVLDDNAPCRCAAQVQPNIERGWLDPKRLPLVRHRRDNKRARAHIRGVGEVLDAIELFRRHPDYRAPDELVSGLRALIQSGRFGILN